MVLRAALIHNVSRLTTVWLGLRHVQVTPATWLGGGGGGARRMGDRGALILHLLPSFGLLTSLCGSLEELWAEGFHMAWMRPLDARAQDLGDTVEAIAEHQLRLKASVPWGGGLSGASFFAVLDPGITPVIFLCPELPKTIA